MQVHMEDTETLQVIEELEELMQSSPDPEADPEGDEEEEEEEEEAEADAKSEGGSGGTEPILPHELQALSPTNNNCSHEGTAAAPEPGAIWEQLQPNGTREAWQALGQLGSIGLGEDSEPDIKCMEILLSV